MMTDAEVADQIERADRFREELRDAVNEAVAAVSPDSHCADEARTGLAKIAATLDDVDYVTFANLSNIDAAMKNKIGTGLMPMITLHLIAVGGGPELDCESASDFLAAFKPMIDLALKRKRH